MTVEQAPPKPPPGHPVADGIGYLGLGEAFLWLLQAGGYRAIPY